MKDFSALPNTVGAFPDVAAVDDPTGVGVLGTPWIAALIDEWFGAYQSVLDRAGLLPNALDEVHDNSQITQGLAKEHSEQTIRPDSPLIDIARGSWYNDTMSQYHADLLNSVDIASSPIVGLGVYFPDGVKKILVLDAGGNQVHIIDPVSMTIDSSSGVLGGLGAGAWVPDAMCNDNDYVYIMFHDGTVPPIHKIQSYSLSTWATNAGWPAAGTTLAAGVVLLGLAEQRDRVIFANDTTLACLNSWVAASAANTRVIETIDLATGAVTAFGAGDVTGAAGKHAWHAAMYSDGTNLYYSAYDSTGATVAQCCSATIANPQVGCGGAGWPMTAATAGQRYTGICGSGGTVFVMQRDNSANTTKLHVADSTSATLFRADVCSSTTNGFEQLSSAVFDGCNVWSVAMPTDAGLNDGAGNYVKLWIKIDVGLARWSDAVVAVGTGDRLIRGVYNCGIDPTSTVACISCATLFDGRDLWAAPDIAAAGTYPTRIFRLPRVMVR